MKTLILLFCSFLMYAQSPYVMVLGVAQDGGYPQAGCQKTCCKPAWEDHSLRKKVSCIAIIDPQDHSAWIIDATPDFKDQYQMLLKHDPKIQLKGILLTHAHVGHYTGLMHLGREIMGANQIPIMAMPKMANFLQTNGPWSQLVNLKNILISPIKANETFALNSNISILPILVPHRDEFSETVGYQIVTEKKKLFFLPDIDKWEKWEKKIYDVIYDYDYLLLDGTFYQDGEISRPMAEVPHPFVIETTDSLWNLPSNQKSKVHFIHFNHTNPLLNTKSVEHAEVLKKSFNVAFEGQVIGL